LHRFQSDLGHSPQGRGSLRFRSNRSDVAVEHPRDRTGIPLSAGRQQIESNLMIKTNLCASIAALALLALASVAAAAAVGQQGLRPAADTGDPVLVTTKTS